jgi:hypothetical protein
MLERIELVVASVKVHTHTFVCDLHCQHKRMKGRTGVVGVHDSVRNSNASMVLSTPRVVCVCVCSPVPPIIFVPSLTCKFLHVLVVL